MQSLKLNSNWLAARVGDVQWTGEQLTTTNPPQGSSDKWMEAVVPGTILTTLLRNKLIPDPFYGLENENIVDIADAGREYYTFWFFTKFELTLKEHMCAWLQFRGINYQAEVFLNGHKQLLPKGMFRRHMVDITNWLNSNGSNLLAVLVHPPDHPGRIPPEGGQGGDHNIAKDVTTQYVEGWDWMCPIRDRNTGIWDEVSVFTTGPVKISDPHLVGSFFDNFKRCYLHTSTEITNASSKSLNCILKLQASIEVEGEICLIEHMTEQELVIGGATTIMYTFPPLFFYKPQLWWPNGMGEQALYKVDIIIEVEGYGESDSWSHLFGFRKIESHIDPSTGGRLFSVNGQPVFIRGGNWIVSDGLLRLSENRYRSDIDFHADMNFNMIRCWGGGISERPEFYQNCDRRGLLVWQEFWITGDNNGRSVPPSASDPNWPLDHQLFLTCAKDTIKMLRNYASLALWVGGNEQHPAPDLNKQLMKDLQLHPFFQHSLPPPTIGSITTYVDPSRYLDGTRIYIQGSLWDGFAKGNGDFTDGPYVIQNPEDFFKEGFYPYGFNPEVGSVGTPVAATIRATMPSEAWQLPQFARQPDGYIKEVPNSTWDYHKYIPYSNPGTVHDQIESYGEPKDLDDFCGKAQLVNYVQYRALMEGWTSSMWTKYTGVLIWKNLNPWTALRGQFYDHLHDQTGGFFGIRLACEPVHVQLNLATHFVEVVNTTATVLTNVSVEATVWDLDGVCPYHNVAEHLTIPSKLTIRTFEMQYANSKSPRPVYFLLLRLSDESNKTLISRNFYWIHLPGGNYKPLEGIFKSREIPLRARIKGTLTGKSFEVTVQITNLSIGVGSVTQVGQEQGTHFTNSGVFYDNEVDNTKDIESPALLSKLWKHFSPKDRRPSAGSGYIEIENMTGYSGVAFWLHFSVVSGKEGGKPGVDTRILPVYYSQNYFSLVPGENIDVEIKFDLPEGVVPHLILEGWNIKRINVPLQFA
eukprot:c22324_g1_i1 orf=833-3763(-)